MFFACPPFERADALEHERTHFTGDSPDDPFEAYERGRSVRAVHIRYSTCPSPSLRPGARTRILILPKSHAGGVVPQEN